VAFKQTFLVVFSRLPEGHLRREILDNLCIEAWWMRLLYSFMPRRRHRDDFAHCKAILVQGDTHVMLTTTPQRWMMGVKVCETGELLNELHPTETNAVLRVVRSLKREGVARPGKLCHTVIANILGLKTMVWSPYGLYLALKKEGAQEIWRYRHG